MLPSSVVFSQGLQNLGDVKWRCQGDVLGTRKACLGGIIQRHHWQCNGRLGSGLGSVAQSILGQGVECHCSVYQRSEGRRDWGQSPSHVPPLVEPIIAPGLINTANSSTLPVSLPFSCLRFCRSGALYAILRFGPT